MEQLWVRCTILISISIVHCWLDLYLKEIQLLSSTLLKSEHWIQMQIIGLNDHPVEARRRVMTSTPQLESCSIAMSLLSGLRNMSQHWMEFSRLWRDIKSHFMRRRCLRHFWTSSRSIMQSLSKQLSSIGCSTLCLVMLWHISILKLGNYSQILRKQLEKGQFLMSIR